MAAKRKQATTVVSEKKSHWTPEDFSDDISAVVVQPTSTTLRIGYGGLYEMPSHEFSVDKDKFRTAIPYDVDDTKPYFSAGKVVSWDDFEKHMEYALDDLHCDKDDPILYIEGAEFDKKERLKLAEIFFEKLGRTKLLVMPDAPLSLVRKALSSGIVMDFGYKSTTFSLVDNNFLVRNSVVKVPIGSEYILRRFGKLKKLPSCFNASHYLNEDETFLDCTEGLFDPSQTDYDLCPELRHCKRWSGLQGAFDIMAAKIPSVDVATGINFIYPTGGLLRHRLFREKLYEDLIDHIVRSNIQHNPRVDPSHIPTITWRPYWDAWRGGALVAGFVSMQDKFTTMFDYFDDNIASSDSSLFYF